jgi:hypothetical protein
MPRESRAWLLLLLGLTLIHGLIYAVVIPPWQGPDETGHFEYVWLLDRLARVPTQNDLYAPLEQEMLASLYEWHYGDFIQRPLPEQMPARIDGLPKSVFAYYTRPVVIERFSLAYLWQVLYLLPFRSQDLLVQLYAGRLSSVVLNVGIVWLSYLTLCQLFPTRLDLAALTTSVVVFLPQHTFINSMVGDGPLAELMSCLVLYCWVSIFQQGLSIWRVAAIVSGTLVGLWSKNTALYLVPVDIGLGVWWLVRQRHSLWRWRHVAYLCASTALLGAGLWIWSHSALGQRALPWLRALPALFRWAWVDQRGTTLGQALLAGYDGLWANFGWMSLPIGARWYGAITLLTALALWGWCFGRRQEPQAQPVWSIVMMGGTLVAALVGSFWVGLALQPGLYQFQGRYLFPALIPFAFLLIGGLDRLLDLRANSVTRLAVVLFLVVLDSWCLFGVIIPYYYA